jgi:riboflavin synthase
MFTGIIETLGTIKEIVKDNDNVHITVQSNITNELKIDQSVAHNGVCLTVVAIENYNYTVTAIKETMDKTNLSGTSHEIRRSFRRTYCSRSCGSNWSL